MFVMHEPMWVVFTAMLSYPLSLCLWRHLWCPVAAPASTNVALNWLSLTQTSWSRGEDVTLKFRRRDSAILTVKGDIERPVLPVEHSFLFHFSERQLPGRVALGTVRSVKIINFSASAFVSTEQYIHK